MPTERKPQTYEQYAGYATSGMRRLAIEAGCRTIAEMEEWWDKHYGRSSQREQNRSERPPPYRRPHDRQGKARRIARSSSGHTARGRGFKE